MSGTIKYSDGWKYRLEEPYAVRTNIHGHTVHTEFIHLSADGYLRIDANYMWDGPSGPTLDTRNFMRGSLVHDAIYQLIRLGHLPISCRRTADNELQRICREDGMCWPRTWYVRLAVRRFAWRSVEQIKPIKEAP